MGTTRATWRGGVAVVLTALLALTLTGGLTRAGVRRQEGTDHRGQPVTVMTRNLYLGADINRPVNAALPRRRPAGRRRRCWSRWPTPRT